MRTASMMAPDELQAHIAQQAASARATSETESRPRSLDVATCSAVGGEYYQGIEWLACWLLDNVEGETITEESLRPWAVAAWQAHLKRQNADGEPRSPKTTEP